MNVFNRDKIAEIAKNAISSNKRLDNLGTLLEFEIAKLPDFQKRLDAMLKN